MPPAPTVSGFRPDPAAAAAAAAEPADAHLEGCRHLARLARLQCLMLNNCEDLGNGCLEALADGLSGGGSLMRLALSDCGVINNQGACVCNKE